MPEKVGNPLSFFQELKRRKVVRVIIVYAAASLAILEFVSIIEEPFGLPDWTIKLIFILLGIGLIITVILSWIYDITPEGIEKTRPSKEIRKDEKTATPNSWKIATYVSVIIILGLLAYNILSDPNTAVIDESLEKSIAVLPFDNMSIGEENSHLGFAIADEIIMELQKIKAFDRVISRSSTIQYKDIRPTVPEMAEKLGVNYIIEGSIQRQEERVSVRVQVIRAMNEDHVWGEEYERSWKDINFIQDDIAKNVAEELKVVMSSKEIELIEKLPTGSNEAYQLYLLGKYHFHEHTKGEVEKGIEYFNRAIQLDPNFALAYVYLAQSYQLMARYAWSHPGQLFEKASEAVYRAIELDESLGEAYATLGLLRIVFHWDIYGPDQVFQKAIQLSPSSAEVYSFYAQYLRFLGRYEQGIRIAKKAMELDPLSSYTSTLLGGMYFWSGQYDRSIEELNRLMIEGTDFYGVYLYLSWSYTMKGLYPEAIHFADKTVTSIGDLYSSPVHAADIGWVYGKAGETKKAEDILTWLNSPDQKEYIDPMIIATVYTGLGDFDNAISYLQKGYEIHSGMAVYMNALSNNIFRDLSSDPRYGELLNKIGFKVN